MFYKEKGFYVSMIAGILAIIAISAICMNMLDTKDEKKTPQSMVADATNAPTATQAPVTREQAKEVAKIKPKQTSKPTPKTKEVLKNTNPVMHFNQEKGLLWPVKGEVLLSYSPDHVIYHKTLEQYRTSDAIVIESKEGTEVHASATGIVRQISKNAETGTTVEVSLGDDYSVIYGQMQKVTVKKGERIKEGQSIGQIAKPTKYYSAEGDNLYYQVKEKGKTVNPLLLLR